MDFFKVSGKYDTDNALYTYTQYNDKIRLMTIWLSRNLRLRGNNWTQIMQETFA